MATSRLCLMRDREGSQGLNPAWNCFVWNNEVSPECGYKKKPHQNLTWVCHKENTNNQHFQGRIPSNSSLNPLGSARQGICLEEQSQNMDIGNQNSEKTQDFATNISALSSRCFPSHIPGSHLPFHRDLLINQGISRSLPLCLFRLINS